MKKLIITISSFLVLTAFIGNQSANIKTFKKLYALEGRWIMKTQRGAIGEQWLKMDKDYLQSRGFFVKGNDTIITERVALRNTGKGIYYTSTVEDQNNKQPIPFKFTSEKNNAFVFENPEHDFPKRIVYEIVSIDSLHAYIDGGVNGSGKREDFYYRKVN